MIRNKALIYTAFKQGGMLVVADFGANGQQFGCARERGERIKHAFLAQEGAPAAANPLSCRVHTTLGVRDD
jgi:hypothetical protein